MFSANIFQHYYILISVHKMFFTRTNILTNIFLINTGTFCTTLDMMLIMNKAKLFMMSVGGSHDIQTKLRCIWHLVHHVHSSRFILIVFSFSSAEAWNRLPAYVRISQSIGVFKSQYCKWYAGHS